MPNVLVQESSIQAIADAIRYKTGGTDTYKPRAMAPAIRNLPGTGVMQNLSVTENGNYSPGAGVDGFDSVSVAVPNSALSSTDEGKVVLNGALMPQTSLSVTANGTYDTTDKNSVAVNVGGGSSTILSGYGAPSSSLGSNGNLYLELMNYADNVVLLHFDGDTITDVTGNTIWTATGNVQLSGEQSRFGGKSLYLNGGWLYSQATSLANLSDYDFTIDCWVYTSKSGWSQMVGTAQSWTWAFALRDLKPCAWASTNGSRSGAIINADTSSGVSTTAITANQWTHLAMVRNGTNISLYLNGTRVLTATCPTNASIYSPSGDCFRIGHSEDVGNRYFYGYIDELRILKGVAAWTDEFTPPTAPYELSTGQAYLKRAWIKVNGTWEELGGQPFDSPGSV